MKSDRMDARAVDLLIDLAGIGPIANRRSTLKRCGSQHAPLVIPLQPELSIQGRCSGRYETMRADRAAFVYEASWHKIAHCLLWNCTIWANDRFIGYRAGSELWPVANQGLYLSALVEAAIEDIAAQKGDSPTDSVSH